MRLFTAIFMLVFVLGCTSDNRKTDAAPVTDGNDSIMRAHGYDVLNLYKTKTGHITVSIKVNGKPCVFLIDTGGGATIIDISKKNKYGLKAFATSDYAAGIGSVSALVRTSAVLQINDYEFSSDSLYMMDTSYMNAEFRKNKSRKVDGVLGTDFLEKYGAIINYPRSKMYLNVRQSEGN